MNKQIAKYAVIGLLAVVGGPITIAALSIPARTAGVISQEAGPKSALKKYEWFKDAAANLQKKQADISVLEQRVATLTRAYEGIPRTQWDRQDKQDMTLWQQELAGVVLSYNRLAAEYNAASSKFNWAPFQGDIPQEFATANYER